MSEKRIYIKMVFFVFMLAACICFMNIDVKASAATVKSSKSMDGNWEYLTNDDGTLTITGYLGEKEALIVPEMIDGRVVAVIGEKAFEGHSELISITFADSITEIGDFALNDCSGLTSIILPDKITEIGNFVFDDCSGLTEIIIPEGVTSIGVCAFYGCSGLRSITLPDGVTSIGNRAFARCRALNSITIPESVLSMGELVFDGSTSSLTIYTPEGSYAEKYAKQCNIAVEIIARDELPLPLPSSEPLHVIEQTQIIQAKSLTKTYGSKPFYLNATTNGDGALSYSVANKKVAAVNSGGKVTIKGYGKTTITIKAVATQQYSSAIKKITITVIPKTPTLTKISSLVRRQLSCSWTKGKNVTGYEIEVSPDRKFEGRTIQRKVGGKVNSTKTPPLLKSGTTYYVRVRAYKKMGKTKYCSRWSKVKKVKVR